MRKDLLASSLKAVKEGKSASDETSPAPRKTSGVMAVQKGLEHLSSGAPQDVDTALIQDSIIKDRFSVRDGLDDLKTSIERSGQKLPVLLRRTKGAERPYEVVFGRRRIEACRQIGIPVRAHITDMSDHDALVSQGLENAARLQRSYIEQAVYAYTLFEHNLSRDEVMDVLAVDETTISRMLGVVRVIPDEIIRAIGPAHDAGRRPWLQLRELINAGQDTEKVLKQINVSLPSKDRLTTLVKQLTTSEQPAKPEAAKRSIAEGSLRIERSPSRLLIKVKGNNTDGFTEFLDERMDSLLAEFRGEKK